ncbi:acetyltransferase [Aeromicrobium sp. Root344]|uniref:acyltransferase n=1 Tax=Aeromicrobium sp. Root344 TaxID=1736521 RepID=UPI0006FA8E06|nr:acyltransferase [Aeromicrobium sp. Root344]KQV74684.1 acetyltransferase [Aeromicrobium sp. Root344]
MSRPARIWAHVGEAFYNAVMTYVPSHTVRIATLRLWGARIGRDCSLLRGTTVLGIAHLEIGEAVSIGFRCVLDARGGLTIGSNTVIASDTHFVGAFHDVHAPDFPAILEPIVVEEFAWLAVRSTVLCGVTIGRGAVVSACSLVREDVPAMDIVAGVPAVSVGTRRSTLDYRPVFRPLFF